jgi:hypothetical protein
MPFGKKPDADGRSIDFDAVYEEFIKPAIESVGLGEPKPLIDLTATGKHPTRSCQKASPTAESEKSGYRR